MTTELLPADVQMRADAEVGAAWRRCEAAVPDRWGIAVERMHGVYIADAHGADFATTGETPAEALTALAELLEGRAVS